MTIPFTPVVKELPASTPFVGPETLERQHSRQFKARIGANESAFGISPKALRAMADSLSHSCWYADPENYELREALAQKHGVNMDEIVVDAGIDSLLGLTVRMLVPQGGVAVTSLGAYPTFNYHVAGFGATLQTVPYNGFHEDPDALLHATRLHNAPLVYFANPDNPMGTWHDANTVSRLIDNVPDNTILALDEAYIEFADTDIAPPIDTGNRGVIRYRTFSKAYGMAGQRIAYAIAHRDIISGFNKIRNHFGINRVAQIGALASVQDEAFLPEVRSQVAKARQQVMDFAQQRGLYAEPSYTNFVALDLQTQERASAMIQHLASQAVFMRMPGAEPLNRCIRVGLGSAAEFELFAKAFDDGYGSLP
ncbi:MAG: aminotransferase class I/II-fold pyridoxal phosphate-dependent enzyme [Pseudomonadota bacterium]